MMVTTPNSSLGQSTSLGCGSQHACSYTYMDYTQHTAVQAIFITLYSIIIVLAILGNTLVIWTVRKNPSLHNLTNYYIVNLSVSDILIAVFVVPMRLFEYMAPLDWRIFNSDILCGIVQYLMPVFVFSSVLTLIAVSIERYQAVIDPFSSLHASRTCRRVAILITIWLVPIILCVPFVYYKSDAVTLTSSLGTIHRQMCKARFQEIDVWLYGEGAESSDHFLRGFNLILFTTMYIIPFLIISYSSLRIALHLLLFVERIELGRRSSWLLFEENKRKVAKMVVVVAIFFFISWTPFYVINVISLFYTDMFSSNYIFIMLLTHLIGFTNCCTNPFIYIIMCDKFNDSFWQLVRKIRMCICLGYHGNPRHSISTVLSGKTTTEMVSFREKSARAKRTHFSDNCNQFSRSADDSEYGAASPTTPCGGNITHSTNQSGKRKMSTSTLRETLCSDSSEVPSGSQRKTRRFSVVTEKLEQEFSQTESPGLIMLPNLKQKSVKKLLRKISVGASSQGQPGTPNIDREELDQWKGSLHCLLDIQLADSDNNEGENGTLARPWSTPNLTLNHFSFETDSTFQNENKTSPSDHSAVLESSDRTRILDDFDGADVNDSRKCVQYVNYGAAQKAETLSLSDVSVSIPDEMCYESSNGRTNTKTFAKFETSSTNGSSTEPTTPTKVDSFCQTDLLLPYQVGHRSVPSGLEKESVGNGFPSSSGCVSHDCVLGNNKMDKNNNVGSLSLEEARKFFIQKHSRTSQEILSRTQPHSRTDLLDKSTFKFERNYPNSKKNGAICDLKAPVPLKHKAYTRVSKSGSSITTLDGRTMFRLCSRTSRSNTKSSSPTRSPDRNLARKRYKENTSAKIRLPYNKYTSRSSPSLLSTVNKIKLNEPSEPGFVTDSDMELTYTLKMRTIHKEWKSCRETDNSDRQFEVNNCAGNTCGNRAETMDAMKRSANKYCKLLSGNHQHVCSCCHKTMQKDANFSDRYPKDTTLCDFCKTKMVAPDNGQQPNPSKSVDYEHATTLPLDEKQSYQEWSNTSNDPDMRKPKHTPAFSEHGVKPLIVQDSSMDSPRRRRSGVEALNQHNVPLQSTNPDIVYLDIITRTMQEMISIPDPGESSDSHIDQSATGRAHGGSDIAPYKDSSFEQDLLTKNPDHLVRSSNAIKLPPTIREVVEEQSDIPSGKPEVQDLSFGENIAGKVNNTEDDDSMDSIRSQHGIGEIRRLSVDSKASFLVEAPSKCAPNILASSRQRKVTPVLQATATKLRKLMGSGHVVNGSMEPIYHTSKYDAPIHI